MSDEALPTGPDPEAIKRTILEALPRDRRRRGDGCHVLLARRDAAGRTSRRSSRPTSTTWAAPSRLTERDGVFRLNIGVGQGDVRAARPAVPRSRTTPPSTRILPHPVYAKQRWISILNPSEATFRDVVLPLIDEAPRSAGRRTGPSQRTVSRLRTRPASPSASRRPGCPRRSRGTSPASRGALIGSPRRIAIIRPVSLPRPPATSPPGRGAEPPSYRNTATWSFADEERRDVARRGRSTAGPSA